MLLKVPSAEVERKAREIVEKSGANSEERFNRVVLGESTFRDQAKTYLNWVQTRDREPIKDASSIEAALNKWILPEIGDLPLADVHNITVKPLVDNMKKSLSARTVTGVRKEVLAFVLLYNLTRRVMLEATTRQGVAADRVSFVDALRWLLWSPPGAQVPELLVNPRRRRPSEPRRLKRGRKRFPQLRRPRNASRKPVAEVRM